MKKTNTLNMSLFILILTLEISFTRSVSLNIFLIGLAVLFFLFQKKGGSVILLILLPLIPAFSTYWSVMLNGSGSEDAILLMTRTYAFAALGLSFAVGVDLEELLLVLEQKGVAPNFIYGLLVVVHSLPAIKNEVRAIQEASLLKGKKLYFWSPMFYIKTIFLAFTWRDHYTEAMYSHGYDETGVRTHQQRYISSLSGALWLSGLFFIGNILLFL